MNVSGSSYTLLFRLVGETEYNKISSSRKTWYKETKDVFRLQEIDVDKQRISKELEKVIIKSGDKIFEHINGANQTGCIGGGQTFVSLFRDIDKIKNTKDSQLRKILEDAPYMLSFTMPAGTFFDIDTEMCKIESEVLTLNDSGFLIRVCTNWTRNPLRKI